MSRRFVFAIVVIAAVLPTGCTGRNSPPAKKNAIPETDAAVSDRPKSDLEIGHTVCLTVREPEADGPEGGVAPMGVREIVRQAFLMAASDELGLPTRDCMLREGFPEKQDEASAPFELYCHSTDPANSEKIECVLTRRGAPEKVLWRVNYVPKQYPTLGMLSIDAEVWARKDLKEVLERAGFKGSVPPHRASSEVAQATYDLLWTWNEISVMAGLRRLHEELRQKGESPEIVAALAVGTSTWERWSSTTSAAHAKCITPGRCSINSGCRN